METTFVIENRKQEYAVEVDYRKSILIVNHNDFIVCLSRDELTKIEDLEAATMLKNTKRSWLLLESYLKKLFLDKGKSR